MTVDLRDLSRTHVADIELPDEVKHLYDLAYNLWWTWEPGARILFNSIDSRTWGHYRNPVQLLINFDRNHWHEKLEDEEFLAQYRRVMQAFDSYMEETAQNWFAKNYPDYRGGPVAYFCMEFGVHQSLALYSGGLGVLAGDHLKSASDLGVPLVAVGLLYRNGYFRQNVDADGWQQHIFPDYDFSRLPIRPAAGHTGRGVFVRVPFPDREVVAKVWVAQIGRVPLVLLDTDVPQNHASDRPITGSLYTPGREMRLAQELVLGIGGVRALRAIGIAPSIWHMNEGHSALMQIERLREAVEERGTPFTDAVAELRSSSVFTTHTPIPAGNETFDRALMRKYLEGWAPRLVVPVGELLALGNGDHGEADPPFNLTALAIRSSRRINGVSRINASVAQKMWNFLLPAGSPETPTLVAITNGVHPATWLGPDIQHLLAKWLGENWRVRIMFRDGQQVVLDAPPRELWEAHGAQKSRLARFLRSRLRHQFARHGRSPDELRAVESLFDPAALTIGFARRFATYKRAGLIFSDLPRLRLLLAREEQPVQILLAGKAHPADHAGQELIQHLYHLSQEEKLRGKVFFLEDYDMRVARMLVQGVDVWLNTPQRPLEASGTSGMKAAMNGALNCSIADGWWPEGFDGENGWVIGKEAAGSDAAQQDRDDAQSLYALLEEEIVPLYYRRDESGLPIDWLRRMRQSMATIMPRFSSDRMIKDYCRRSYLPVALGAPPEGTAVAPTESSSSSEPSPAGTPDAEVDPVGTSGTRPA